jgi:hypothetical protein
MGVWIGYFCHTVLEKFAGSIAKLIMVLGEKGAKVVS